METWTISQGSQIARTITFNDENGNKVTTWPGAGILDGSIWIGGDAQQLFDLGSSLSWVNSTKTSGQVNLVVPGSATISLDPGLYRLIITVDGNDAFESALDIKHAPGTEAPARVYCSYEDVLRVARWVEQVQDPDEDQAGFLAQRVQAREEIDDAIVSCYRGTSIGQFGMASLAAIGWAGGGPRRSNMTPYIVREYLNGRNPGFPSVQTSPTGFLMRRSTVIDPGIYIPASTPALQGLSSDQKLDFYAKADRPMTNRLAAYRTAALIGLGQIGVNNTHATYGAVCNSQFERLMTAYTAELDINLDGLCEIAIKCGSTNTLYT